MFYQLNLFPQVKKGLTDQKPFTKGSSFAWISCYNYKVFDVLVLMAEQETFLKPTQASLSSRGEERGYFNWKQKGRGHFGSLENGLLSYKPIPTSW